MFYAFNAILLALVALIAYWWINQGLFSALLHFACVVVAGALAFAVWEPVAILLLERDLLPNYAWGIALLGPFSVFLFLSRLACDKLVPDNLNFPQWAHYSFGGAFGAASGILTMGVCLLGGGYLQSAKDVMGFEGAVRTMSQRGQPDFDNQSLWVPMHSIAEQFYGFLSMGAFAPEMGVPLRIAYPGMATMAYGLHRDSYANGKGRTSLPPNGVTLGRLIYSPTFIAGGNAPGAWAVELTFGMQGTDPGGSLAISASQVRLIESLTAATGRVPRYTFPAGYSQSASSGTGLDLHEFDDITNYACNVPGQEKTRVFFIFPASNIGPLASPPQFIEVKRLRLRLPAPEPLEYDLEAFKQVLRGSEPRVATNIPLTDPEKKFIRGNDLMSNYTIDPANGAIGELGTIEHSENYLTYGKDNFQKGGKPPSPVNRVKGIYASEGTSILRLNVSRGESSIDIWDTRTDYRKKAGEDAPLLLVDSEGATYSPVGYIWITSDGVEVSLPKTGIQSVKELPFQPSSGTHQLFAIYRITVGRQIVSIRLGDIILANAEFTVPEQTKR